MYNSQANNPLYKGFICPYCDKALRTRQGLSGHIQFIHGIIGQKKVKKEVKFEITMNGISDTLTVWKVGSKPSKFEYEAVVDMILWWTNVKLLVEGFGLELNEGDLHNYIITSLANIRQNTQLLRQLGITFN